MIKTSGAKSASVELSRILIEYLSFIYTQEKRTDTNNQKLTFFSCFTVETLLPSDQVDQDQSCYPHHAEVVSILDSNLRDFRLYHFLLKIVFLVTVLDLDKSKIERTKGVGKINLANAMSGVFAYISATMPWILQRKVSN